LNQGLEYVRGKIVEFLNGLIDIGIAGIRWVILMTYVLLCGDNITQIR
jgi:hypothetical protein